MKVFYAGDSHAGGAASYLLGVMSYLGHSVLHIPPGKKIKASDVKPADVYILSDFSSRDFSEGAQGVVASRILKSQSGLLMVGGWASFTGLSGAWEGTMIEDCLPVGCLGRDDRDNIQQGAYFYPKGAHRIISKLPVSKPPVICGVNKVRLKPSARVVLEGRCFDSQKKKLTAKSFPFLVVHKNIKIRSAAVMTDFAPHWCGGLVDWGKKRVKIRAGKSIQIEVGDAYIRFIQNILNWLGRK